MAEGQNPIPGWYGDPFDASQIRWWDGTTWTEHAKPFPASEVPAEPPSSAPRAVTPPPTANPPGALPALGGTSGTDVARGFADPTATAASVLPGTEPVLPSVELPPTASIPGSPQSEPHAQATGQFPPSWHSAPSYPYSGQPGGYSEVPPGGSSGPGSSGGSAAPPAMSAGMAPGQQPGQPYEQQGGSPAAFGTGVSEQPPSYGADFGQQSGVGVPAGAYGAYPGQAGQMGGQPQAFGESAGTGPTAAPVAKSRKTMLILLIVLGAVIVVAAAVWFFMLRPTSSPAPTPIKSSPAPTASPTVTAPTAPGAPAVGAIAPAACSSAVSALTADGSASTVVARLEAAATNQSLAEAAGFFTDVTQQTAALMASSGSPCVDAVKAGQAPAAYGAFIEQYSKATHDGAAIAGQGAAANGILTPEQAATLRADAAALSEAAALVAPSAPAAAPAPAS